MQQWCLCQDGGKVLSVITIWKEITKERDADVCAYSVCVDLQTHSLFANSWEQTLLVVLQVRIMCWFHKSATPKLAIGWYSRLSRTCQNQEINNMSFQINSYGFTCPLINKLFVPHTELETNIFYNTGREQVRALALSSVPLWLGNRVLTEFYKD